MEHNKVKYIYRVSLILLDQPGIAELPRDLSEINVVINQFNSVCPLSLPHRTTKTDEELSQDLVIPGLVPDEEMRQGEGDQFRQLKSRFGPILNCYKSGRAKCRDGPYCDMALQAIKIADGKRLYQFEGTSFVGVRE